jgi:F-type H+-transporting ATPase subunit b
MLFASAGAGSSGGGNFLIPNGTFVVELVIFLVVLGVVAKWILPPLQQVTETRRLRIRAALQKADEARVEAQRLLAERDRVLADARAEARLIVDRANKDADVVFEQRRQEGQEEHERLVAASRAVTADDSRRVREELVGCLDTLVVAAAERVLGNGVDIERHRDLIREAVAATTNNGAGAT